LDSADVTTNRTPIQRPALTMISAQTLKLFAELERARRARSAAVDCTISEYGLCTTDCRACRRWFDLHDQLHIELRLNPWQWPCLPRNPYPPGSPKARDWRPGTEAAGLWGLLNEALKEAARRRTSSEVSKADERDTDVESVTGQEPSI
jgi:hypothetical protein